ncbi:Uncharacterized protein BP5553_00343 [Venustampulla echinocandica]|uniref:Uncharacterized protein n=1 Tax=Venustampulla echinocandica TaxID=2656787 RepID=A0A370TXW3_9HELO|nr:Uncharacterized protein BP5553_00343 [Venustampulla echinocandica]RDL40364.1 Uncharacterized protein BP5553_00343 [Venustampulla echinocandica]
MANSYPSGSPGVPDSSMPTGAPGFMPRRSSYASVVSGTAPPMSQSFQQPLRSGAFSHLLNQNADFNYDPNYQYLSGHMRYDSRAYDMDFGANGAYHGRSGSLGRNGYLPSFSSAYGSVMNGTGYSVFGIGHNDYFFVPSYLRGSKYVQKLEEAHKAKIQAHKDNASAQSSQAGSLSTSASSVNLHAKMPASHRGIAYEVIEKSPPEDGTLAPLPSRWNSQDKYGGLEVLSDGQEVKFTAQKTDRDRDHEACAIRADHPMPPQCGIYYFEVTIMSRKREESSIGIGFSSKDVPLSRLPGWEPESWAYHGDDGHSFGCQSTGKHYGPPFAAGDIIGCGVNFRTGSAFFTKNGDHLGTAFREIKGKLFPSVGMKKSGEHIRVNFGQSPFVFDIDGMMSVSPISSTELRPTGQPTFGAGTPSSSYHRRLREFLASATTFVPAGVGEGLRSWLKTSMLAEKTKIYQEIGETSTAKLAPPLNETELIQSLVLQFLSHEGYVETARGFADEVHSERKALTLDPNVELETFDIKEDEDAGHRQRIRAAILEGDVERALKYTNAFYPQVLKENEHVYFRLRCRRFIEMIRQGAEMQNPTATPAAKKSNGHSGDWYDDIINHEMELDDQQPQGNNWDRMDTEESSENQMQYQQLLQETLAYGKDLQAEFKDDPRREVSKALEEAFALIAYTDPLNAKEVSHLLDPKGRVAVAEELNSAILSSLGKSSSAALEQLYQQTSVLLEELREGGGHGAFVNIDDFARPKPGI